MSEKTYWKGSPSQAVNFKLYAICLVLFFLVVPIFYALWKWIELKSHQYELTNQRLKFSFGVFSRQTEEVELYRVKDTRLVEPFLLRLFGCANIVLFTSDRSTPTIMLPAIKKGAEVRETLRSLVEDIRMSKGVREVDFE